MVQFDIDELAGTDILTMIACKDHAVHILRNAYVFPDR